MRPFASRSRLPPPLGQAPLPLAQQRPTHERVIPRRLLGRAQDGVAVVVVG